MRLCQLISSLAQLIRFLVVFCESNSEVQQLSNCTMYIHANMKGESCNNFVINYLMTLVAVGNRPKKIDEAL